MDSESTVFRAAKSFFTGTLLSRVMGMMRDIAMAFSFGGAPEVAAFMVAYRMANLFRRLLGEGNLQGGLVPQFERLRACGDKEAALFYRDLFFSMILVLIALIGVGAAVSLSIAAIVPSDIPLLTLAMMPGVLFLCLYALNHAILQCQNRYFLPAFAPVLFNVVWIIAALLLRKSALRDAMFYLSLSVIGAFALQWLATSWPIVQWIRRSLSWKDWFRPHLFSPNVRSLCKPLAYGVIGMGAAQINSALDAIFARLADPSGPAYLWYAIRIQQLPLALFGIALAGALLPPLSRAIQREEWSRYRALLQASLRRSAAFMIPAAVGLAVLAVDGIDLLYGRGEFSAGDVRETALCLRGYAMGLVPMVFILILANGFYAQKEYRWPMSSSAISVACNIFLNALFVFGFEWGAMSISLATSLSAFVNCALLVYGLQKRMGFFSLFEGGWRVGFCSLGAACVAILTDQIWIPQRELISQLIRLLTVGGLYGASVLGFAYALDVKEILAPLREWGVRKD